MPLWSEVLGGLAEPSGVGVKVCPPFEVPTGVSNKVLETVFGKEWVVAPDQPLPADLQQEILRQGVAPERALMVVARNLPGLELVQAPHGSRPAMETETVDVSLPAVAVRPGQIVEVKDAEKALAGWFDRLPLARDDYQSGTVVRDRNNIVTAAEVFTPPIVVE